MATNGEATRNDSKENNISSIVHLAQTFSTCVECFGLIHPSKEWERAQLLLLCQLGIQQARLLAWGDNLGICETGSNRDARLDDPEKRPMIEKALQSIIDRPAHVHRVTQFEKYGLKPPKRFSTAYQPALDTTRLEVFREKFEMLNRERWEVRRGMSVTAHHWSIVDCEKFKTFIGLVRDNVDSLIQMMGNEANVDRAVKHDIRALGWHPIFDKVKAAGDMSKLRLIREACEKQYPEYAAVTEGALDYINREWKDSYQDAMEARTAGGVSTFNRGSEIPGAAARLAQKAAKAESPKGERRPSLFNVLRRSWRKSSKDESAGRSLSASEMSPEQRSKSADDTANRSMSVSTASGQGQMLSPPLTPERSKSISYIPMRPPSKVET
jgi:Prion-inhibition and propagation